MANKNWYELDERMYTMRPLTKLSDVRENKNPQNKKYGFIAIKVSIFQILSLITAVVDLSQLAYR